MRLELSRRNPAVTVIGVAVMSELPNVKAIISERKLGALTIAQSDLTGTKFGITTVPPTYVIDQEGRIRVVHATALAEVVAIITKELAIIRGN